MAEQSPSIPAEGGEPAAHPDESLSPAPAAASGPSQRGLLAMLALLAVIGASSLWGLHLWRSTPAPPAAPTAAAPGIAAIEELRPRIDQVAFHLIDQDGKPFDSSMVENRWWVGTFLFTGCGSTCPLMARSLKRVQDAIVDAPPTIRIVAFSVDPDNDTPERLRQFAAAYGADPGRWTFATGDKETIWTLAKVGFRLGVMEGDANSTEAILHSRRLGLVSPDGQVREFYDGLDAVDVDRLIARLKAIANDDP